MVHPKELFLQLHQCSRLLNRLNLQEIKGQNDIHLHQGQGRILMILSDEDGLSQKEIGLRMDIKPASVGELVAKIEQSGFVEKHYAENDKRISNVYLTTKGREQAYALKSSMDNLFNELFSGLTEDEKEELYNLLTKLRSSAENSKHLK